jgi:hypothetical protein
LNTYILTKIKKVAQGWTPKTLSSPGREVLIKAVCQAIPTYSMSCFRLSENLCKKIVSCIARFWWGGDENKRKIPWRMWKDLAIPKSAGGMGFRELTLFNQALLAKQGWRLITKPDSLCARVLRGKYYHDTEFMSAKRKRNASHTWNAILFGREALKKGLIKRVGDGSSIRIWEDPWIPMKQSMRPLVRDSESEFLMVRELIDENLCRWDLEKLEENFEPIDVKAICAIPIGRFSEDDWAWSLEKRDNFTVKSAYQVVAIEAQRNPNPSSTGETSNAC